MASLSLVLIPTSWCPGLKQQHSQLQVTVLWFSTKDCVEASAGTPLILGELAGAL